MCFHCPGCTYNFLQRKMQEVRFTFVILRWVRVWSFNISWCNFAKKKLLLGRERISRERVFSAIFFFCAVRYYKILWWARIIAFNCTEKVVIAQKNSRLHKKKKTIKIKDNIFFSWPGIHETAKVIWKTRGVNKRECKLLIKEWVCFWKVNKCIWKFFVVCFSSP